MLAVAAASAAGCTSVNAEQETDVVVAASLELSGSAADLGTAYKRALELRVAQINSGGLLGRRRLALRVRDNRSDPAIALTQITEFTGDPDVTAIITGACAECVTGAAKVINDGRLPTIALSPVAEVSAPLADRRYIFRLAPNVDDDASVLAGELARAGRRKVAFVSSDDAYGRGGAEALAREVAKIGAKVVAHGQYAPADGDLGRAARAATAGSPDAIVVWGYPPQAATAIGALRDAGYRGQVYLDAGAAGELFLGGPAATTDGTALVFTQTLAIDDVIATTPAKAARRQWFQDYMSRYGTYHGHASFAADALQLVVNAVVKSGSTDGDTLRAALETSQIDGLSGQVRLTPSNHSGFMPQSLTMLEARGGRWRLLG
ncbi:ABC transporter substrate-binding protein [Dactylosporangium siamense]|uniref:Branched-chain amino acid ABC transporter n=1 Tax=Dactylosporangium siamense TaxID=685454 RepID=A0A919PRZ7_9ACTN|nr:ABC transporter substrate-binding protein [Dactylosporangium siamense]GIG47333.1 branched-chain amino acid ABC transporter [Dactylosporangium siamense]